MINQPEKTMKPSELIQQKILSMIPKDNKDPNGWAIQAIMDYLDESHASPAECHHDWAFGLHVATCRKCKKIETKDNPQKAECTCPQFKCPVHTFTETPKEESEVEELRKAISHARMAWSDSTDCSNVVLDEYMADFLYKRYGCKTARGKE